MLRKTYELIYDRDFRYLHNGVGDFFDDGHKRVTSPEECMTKEELELYYTYRSGQLGLVEPYVVRLRTTSLATMALTVFFSDEDGASVDLEQGMKIGNAISKALNKDVYIDVVADDNGVASEYELLVLVPYEQRENIESIAQQITRIIEKGEGESAIDILRRKLNELKDECEKSYGSSTTSDDAALWSVKARTVREVLELMDAIEKGGVA